MAIHFQGQVPKQLKDRKKLKEFISSLFRKYHLEVGTVNFMFTDDAAILVANNDFLSHNYYTDIITFDLSTNTKTVDADLLISYETVLSNSEKFNVAYPSELHRVIFHGVLHLCGLNDKTQKEIKIMRDQENFNLSKYFSS